MSFDFTVSDIVQASPQGIYEAWLDSNHHSAMTGSAAICSKTIGGAFTAWDKYISGANLELDPGRRIVQSWRTTKFAATDPDSIIEVLLEPVAGGTRVTLVHRNVPDGHDSYKRGWQDRYFDPMKAYFANSV